MEAPAQPAAGRPDTIPPRAALSRLTDRILPPARDSSSPEDIFSSSLATLFPDDVRNQHGSDGGVVIYRSPRFGDLTLRLADPPRQDERLLFGHYVWNAGVLLAALIEDAKWDVRGQTVLELGAGSGVGGIVSALAGAHSVCLTDYPSPSILAALRSNVAVNLPAGPMRARATVQAHRWGEVEVDGCPRRGGFSRVLVADCLWIAPQHHELARSIDCFLAETPDACAWVVAGFHTGRAVVASFWPVAEQEGLYVEQCWERDAFGQTRPWKAEREEGIGDRAKWSVLAVLRRRRSISARAS